MMQTSREQHANNNNNNNNNKPFALHGWSEADGEKLGRIKKWNQIVKTFSDDIKMKFGSQKCARISLKNVLVYRKPHIGNTMEN
jgi:hypothetical protein